MPSPPASYPPTAHSWPPASHSGVPPSSAPSGSGEFSSPSAPPSGGAGQELSGAEQSMNHPGYGVASLSLALSSAPQNRATPAASSGVASQWHWTYAGASAASRSRQLRGSSWA